MNENDLQQRAAEIAGWPAKNWTELRDAIASALAEAYRQGFGAIPCPNCNPAAEEAS